MTSRRLAAVPEPQRRAVGYVRVSMAREEMVSPELQRGAISDYCKRRGYDLRDTVEDLDATGRNFARLGIQQVLSRLEAGEADVVVVWKFSRFGRDRKGWAVNLDRVETVGGRLESATEEVDATTSTGRFTRGMLAEIAAWESERIGDSWREAHARRLAHGLPHDGRPRFGYTYDKASGYQPDTADARQAAGEHPADATAPVLLDVYRRFADGQSVRSIVRRLNLTGSRTTAGGQWTPITLYRVLDSGFGAGLLYQRTAPGEYLPGAHQAVIDAELWQQVRQVRRDGRRDAPWTRNPQHTLSGLIRCGTCTGPMTCQRSRQRDGTYRRIYRCAARAAGEPCPGAGITADLAEAAVRTWVDELADDLQAAAAAEARRVIAVDDSQVDREHWGRRVARYDAQLVQLNLDRAEGLMPDTIAFVSARDRITSDRAEALEQLERASSTGRKLAGDHRPLIQGLARDWDAMDVQGRRDALRQLLHRVTVHPGEGTGAQRRSRVQPWPIWEPCP